MESAQRAIALKDDDADAWQLFQQVLVLQRKTNEAREAFQRWRQLSDLREAGDQQHRDGEASDRFQAELNDAMAGVVGGGFRSLAQLYQAEGNLRTAQEMLARSLEIAPANTQALASLANIHRLLRDFPAAIKLYGPLLRLEPQQPAHYQNLANLHMQANQAVEAEAALQLACRRLPENGELHQLLAGFLLYLGKPAEAIVSARIARDQLQSAEAQQLLEQAQQALGTRL